MKKLIFAAFALFILPQFVFAGPIVRGGENISIDATQTLEGDFYGVASSIHISGGAEEDVYVVGGKVTVNGNVAKDLTIVAGTAQIHGTVGDDLRVLSGDVVLASPVRGDVVVVGGSLTILSTASVGGEVLFWGGELVVEGAVGEAIHGVSESIRINASVGGDIEFTASRSFTLGDKASVAGSITHTGFNDIVRSQGAVVEGDVHHVRSAGEGVGAFFEFYFFMLATLLFSTLVAFFLARGVLERAVRKSVASFGLHGFIGIGTLILVPIAASVLLVSVVGGIVGAIVFAAYFMALFSAFVLGIVLIGYVAQRFILKREIFTLYTPIIGCLAVIALLFIPVVGPFAVFCAVIVSLGGIAHTAYLRLRR